MLGVQRIITGALWLSLGGALSVIGSIDSWRFVSEPEYASLPSLHWYSSSLIPGLVQIALALVLLLSIVKLRWFVLVLSGVQVAYEITFMLFGPEGSVLYQWVTPVLVLALSVWTALRVRVWFSRTTIESDDSEVPTNPTGDQTSRHG